MFKLLKLIYIYFYKLDFDDKTLVIKDRIKQMVIIPQNHHILMLPSINKVLYIFYFFLEKDFILVVDYRTLKITSRIENLSDVKHIYVDEISSKFQRIFICGKRESYIYKTSGFKYEKECKVSTHSKIICACLQGDLLAFVSEFFFFFLFLYF
jgi:phosphatidylglycerophosphatase A